jgi:CMP-N,N'-diacetyllegionaminic acid synthase
MINDKKILVVIPARGGSKGVKLKNLREVRGLSLIGHVGKVISELPLIDRAVVSTDHDQIAAESEKYGLSVPFRRPEILSGDRIGDLEVLTHALIESEKMDQTEYDIIVMLQPTSPLRRPEDVLATINKLIDEQLDSTWTVSETDSKGHPFKQLVIGKNNSLDYYDKENGQKIIARQQLVPVFHRNGIAYAITRSCLLNKKSIHGDAWAGVIIDRPCVSIDTEFDFKLTEFYFDQT